MRQMPTMRRHIVPAIPSHHSDLWDLRPSLTLPLPGGQRAPSSQSGQDVRARVSGETRMAKDTEVTRVRSQARVTRRRHGRLVLAGTGAFLAMLLATATAAVA